MYVAIREELRARDVEPQVDVAAELVARLLDRLGDRLQRLLVGAQVRREAALVADGRVHALRLQHGLQRVEHLDAVAQTLGECRRADGQDHELLDVDAVVRVRAAVDDVHHRQRHAVARLPRAEQFVQRQAALGGVRLRVGKRDRQDRIGAEPSFGGRAIELDEPPIELALPCGIQAQDRFADLAVDVRDRLCDALTEIALLVAVAQLVRLARPRRGARRHSGTPARTARQHDFGLDGGVAPRVDDLEADHILDSAHFLS